MHNAMKTISSLISSLIMTVYFATKTKEKKTTCIIYHSKDLLSLIQLLLNDMHV